jgi:hypothetical protein
LQTEQVNILVHVVLVRTYINHTYEKSAELKVLDASKFIDGNFFLNFEQDEQKCMYFWFCLFSGDKSKYTK